MCEIEVRHAYCRDCAEKIWGREARRAFATIDTDCVILKGSPPAPLGCIWPKDLQQWREIAETGLMELPTRVDGVTRLVKQPADAKMLDYARSDGWRAFTLNGVEAVLAVLAAMTIRPLVSISCDTALIAMPFVDHVDEILDYEEWCTAAATTFGERFRRQGSEYRLDGATLDELRELRWVSQFSPFDANIRVYTEGGALAGECFGFDSDGKDLCVVPWELPAAACASRVVDELARAGFQARYVGAL